MSHNPLSHSRLVPGDSVRVISFGLSLKGASSAQRVLCNTALEKLGLKVSFGDHVEESDEFDTSSVTSRIEDLHNAVRDPSVKLILSGLGGMNAAQILRSIDWALLEENPKSFCGFSDMAVLVNAIHAKTGIVTYYGPFYGTFGMLKDLEYTIEYFRKCLFTDDPYLIEPAPHWSDDSWWLDQENRTLNPNPGPETVTPGMAEGRVVGGHLTSLATLFGTEFSPDFTDSILFLEENSEIRTRSFDRLLQSVIHQPSFKKVRALVFGRCTSATGIDDATLRKILLSHPELSTVPVIMNASFGHTYPQATLPIGGTARLVATKEASSLEIRAH